MISNASITNRPVQTPRVGSPSVQRASVQKKNNATTHAVTNSAGRAGHVAKNAVSGTAAVPRRTATLKAQRGTHVPNKPLVGRISGKEYQASFKKPVHLQGGKYLYKAIVFENRAELKKFMAIEKRDAPPTVVCPPVGPKSPETPVSTTPPGEKTSGSDDGSGLSLEGQIHKFLSEFSKDIDKKIKDQMDKVK